MYIPSPKTTKKIEKKAGTPVYATSEKILKERAKQLLNAFKDYPTEIFYAIKANFNPSIVRILKTSGIFGIDAVSPFEVQLALNLGFSPNQVIFTGISSSDKELEYIGNQDVLPNLGSISELKRFGKKFPGKNISLRFSPNISLGEFDQVKTGHNESKFGIAPKDIELAKSILKEYNLTLDGIHMHVGSGFYQPQEFKIAIDILLGIAENFESLKFIDIGGGFGVRYHKDTPQINISEFANAAIERLKTYNQKHSCELILRIEPGKFLVSESTVLLTKATMKKTKKGYGFVGVDSGFDTLLRPALYGALHEIINVSNPDGETQVVDVVGNICETGDIFRKNASISTVTEGDILAILSTGGYGSAMSSNYNLRPFAAEILEKEDGEIVLTRKRQNIEDMMSSFVF